MKRSLIVLVALVWSGTARADWILRDAPSHFFVDRAQVARLLDTLTGNATSDATCAVRLAFKHASGALAPLGFDEGACLLELNGFVLTSPVQLRDAIKRLAGVERYYIRTDSVMAREYQLLDTSVFASMETAQAAAERAAASRPVTPLHPPAIDDGDVHCDDSGCELTRHAFDELRDHPETLASAARIVPSFKDGKASGLRLFGIRPSSLLARVGLQNGDNVLAINDLDLSTPDAMLVAWEKLKSARQFVVRLERHGDLHTLMIKVASTR